MVELSPGPEIVSSDAHRMNTVLREKLRAKMFQPLTKPLHVDVTIVPVRTRYEYE